VVAGSQSSKEKGLVKDLGGSRRMPPAEGQTDRGATVSDLGMLKSRTRLALRNVVRTTTM
jgi:hypothetical protein